MNYFTVNELKKIYFEYFVNECGFKKIPDYSLVPQTDNSVLFTPAGMHPLIPYLTGEYNHPMGNKLVNTQRVVRTGAINKVGEDFYLTFFELFGAWIINEYSKEDILAKVLQFITSESYLGIPKEQIYITYFAGNQLLDKDANTLMAWTKNGVAEDHLYPTTKNWKGPYSKKNICGPNTKIYYDTNKEKCSKDCNLHCNCGKYVELWDIVFFDYILQENEIKENPNACIDMGAGVERIATLVQDTPTIYETDELTRIVATIENLEKNSSFKYSREFLKKRRIVADHLRCACFIVGDETTTLPSNKGRGYVLRKIIRRAINNLDQIGLDLYSYKLIIAQIIDLYSSTYPLLNEKREYIIDQLSAEYHMYKLNLEKNILHVKKYLCNKGTASSDEIKMLCDRYGVPINIIMDIIDKNKILDREMEK